MSIDDIKKLAELGATEVTIKPDGTVIAKFDRAPAPTFIPPPIVYPLYPYPWWQQQPFITWGSADNDVPPPSFTVTTFSLGESD